MGFSWFLGFPCRLEARFLAGPAFRPGELPGPSATRSLAAPFGAAGAAGPSQGPVRRCSAPGRQDMDRKKKSSHQLRKEHGFGHEMGRFVDLCRRRKDLTYT